MSTNAVYLARVDQSKLQTSSSALAEAIASGSLGKDVLYVFSDRIAWRTTLERFPDRLTGLDLDGLLVLFCTSAHGR